MANELPENSRRGMWRFASKVTEKVARERGLDVREAFDNSLSGDIARFIANRRLRRELPALTAQQRELLIEEITA